MTNLSDSATGKDALREELEVSFAKERAANLAVVARLEEKYVDRALKFTIPFSGMFPVQAYGHVDGLRFYFRFRSNRGRLKVGPYDQKLEVLRAARIEEDNAKHRKRDNAQCDADGCDDHQRMLHTFLSSGKERVPQEADDDYYPIIISKISDAEGSVPEDHFNGMLTADERYDMFSELVDNLKDVPEEHQLSGFERVWYAEGREAADAWQAQWLEDNKAGVRA